MKAMKKVMTRMGKKTRMEKMRTEKKKERK